MLFRQGFVSKSAKPDAVMLISILKCRRQLIDVTIIRLEGHYRDHSTARIFACSRGTNRRQTPRAPAAPQAFLIAAPPCKLR
jgi:hypothetical protein